jgi:sulfopyruvate decarboxylase subunit alpha
MTPTEGLHSALRSGDLNFFLSVPCKLLADLIAKVETDSDVIYTPVTREEEGIGLASGAHLAGRNPALIMQNSGFGNCANAILSLLNYYRIPIVFIVSHRGSSGEPIDAQRMMGAAVTDLLRVLGVEVLNVPKPEMVSLVQPAIEQARQARRSLAILLPFSFWNAN